MWPKMAWSTSTTGASAHWPKQATVRSEYLPVRRGDAELVGAFLAFVRQPQLQPQPLQQVARAARVAGRAAADADGVLALRLQVEQRVERHHAVDLRQRNFGLLGDVFQNFGRKIFVRMVFLDRFQDAEKAPGLPECAAIVRSAYASSSEEIVGWAVTAAITPPWSETDLNLRDSDSFNL